MALNAAAALLDELMGRSRNFDPNDQPPELHWDSEEVCKHFLCGFCPHELFTNTRADLGICNKIHDEALRKQYVESGRFEKMGYEEDFLRFLQNMISDVEKRIRRGHQRLALNNAQGILNGGFNSAKEDKINMLTEKINELVSQAEELGCEGKVEEAQGVMKLCDQLKEERTQIQNQSGNEDLPQLKQMEVCEVCGAFLIVGDAPQRQDEHLMGKQHAGYAQVRAEIEKRKVGKMKTKAEVEEKQKEKEEKDREVEKEREDRRKKEKEREERERRDRDKEKERTSRRRSHSRTRRSRSRDRRRSGSRERGSRAGGSRERGSRRGSRDRDRRRRSRSKSRDHRKSSKRSHRTRSRSRDKESSSSRRDRDHKRDKGRDSVSKSQSKDRDVEKRRSSEKEEKSRGHSPRTRSDDDGVHSEGDTKKD
ncbi:luc7-like protein 3 isoform X1 [Littorina saxatilis]|uniref:Luc7-like protein 3 n=1 Tax=Littorina saxatilis TaxID=31220 RepID=A0AAN9BST5_9CAEN